MPNKKPPKLKMFLVHEDGSREEVKLTLNWDAIQAGCLRHQKAPEIRRLGQREPHGLFRRISD